MANKRKSRAKKKAPARKKAAKKKTPARSEAAQTQDLTQLARAVALSRLLGR